MLIEIPALLSKKKLIEIQDILARAEFVDGKLSAGLSAQRVKNNAELPPDAAHLNRLNTLVMNTLVQHPLFQSAALPHRIASPFYAKYETGQTYGEHIDDPVMGPAGQRYRSDISCTVFLNSPDDYQGGELEINTQFGSQTAKLEAGSAILYPSTSLHQVKPVTSGTRYVAVTWIQSMIRQAEKRDLLFELNQARETLMREQPNSAITNQVDHSYVNLVRMWSEL
ncbi:MAG: Fe2+-dependent dioxygenase [Thioalkalispiraceae bacterium]|jgi:PKHD-type hydroxylase